jgi:isopentenyl-diphosphate delta-isomerase
MADELIEIIDEQGKVLRQAMKSEAHAHGWLHATVIACMRNGNDWLLVRQTPDRQDAGQLVAPVGGHVQAGENEVSALFREAEEELGIRNFNHALVGRARFHRQVLGRDENHLFVIFEITTNDTIVLGSEAESIERFTIAELKRLIRETPESIGDAHYFLLEHFYPQYLPRSWRPRWKLDIVK